MKRCGLQSFLLAFLGFRGGEKKGHSHLVDHPGGVCDSEVGVVKHVT